MRKLSTLFWALSVAMAMIVSNKTMAQQPVTVTVTIPPLAGMIAPLLSENDTVEVLLQDGASPHGFALKPSHLRLLKKADINIMVGSPVDAWAQKNFAKYPRKIVALNQLQGLERLAFRKGGLWEKKIPKLSESTTHAETLMGKDSHTRLHSHDDHQHENSDTAGLQYDGHLWMSITNAKLLINAFAQKLQTLRPEQENQIQQRLRNWLLKIEQVDRKVAAELKPLQAKPFMVLHDGFQYFEQHYGLTGIGSIRLNPELQPSVKRLLSLRKTLKNKNIQCIFKEPQFPSKQIEKLAQGTDVYIGELDPMGNTYAKAQQMPFVHYDQFVLQLGSAFKRCLNK